ncbi:hypothetical protein OH686_06660 [Pseudomonas sp. SO81]|nr:hypothetical protein OH686_06660 [Pseudomonas sp. SO81]
MPDSGRTRITCHSSIQVRPIRRVGAPWGTSGKGEDVAALANQLRQLMVVVVLAEAGIVLQGLDGDTVVGKGLLQPAEPVGQAGGGRHRAAGEPEPVEAGR